MDFDVTLHLKGLQWSSDWDGEEVGHPFSDVVGLYYNDLFDGTYGYYIDMETMELLEYWKEEEEL